MNLKMLRALRACRDGGDVTRYQVDWLARYALIDRDKRLTVKGAEALEDYEQEENTGD